MRKKIKALFLDWNGTLSNDKFWGHLECGTAKEKKLFLQIEEALFKKNRHLIYLWMRGQKKTPEICQLLSTVSGIDYGFILRELKKSCQGMSLANSQIELLLQQIDIPHIVIATDNMDTFTDWTFPKLKKRYPFFTGYINSSDLGYLKKDFDDQKLNFFQEFLTKNNLEIDECVLIDDSNDEGLSERGLQYLQIDSTDHLISTLTSFTNSKGDCLLV